MKKIDFKGARYSEVERRLWNDSRFREKLSPIPPCGQGLWLYLLTTPELGSIPGLIVMGESAMAEHLHWPLEAFREAFREVFAEGMARADWKARLVVFPKAIRKRAPQSPNVVISWRQQWLEAPDCSLKVEFYRELKAFVEGLGEGFAKAFAKAIANPSSNQDQDQDQDQDLFTHTGPRTHTREANGGSTRSPMSEEAVHIHARIRTHRLFADLDATRLANEHAGFMMARGQKLAWVLEAIDDCAAKTPEGITAEAKQGKLVGFMRHATKGKAPNGGGNGEASKSYESPRLTQAEILAQRKARQKRDADLDADAEKRRELSEKKKKKDPPDKETPPE